MEHRFKKVAVAMMALGLAGAASAGGYAPPEPAPAPMSIPVTIPVSQSMWDLGIEALWMRAGTNNLIHSVRGVNTSNNGFVLDVDDYLESDPSYEWGFRVEGSYHFAGSGKDIHLNWTRVHGSDESDFTEIGAIRATAAGPDRSLGQGQRALDGNLIFTRADFDFDAVNLEFGQHIDVGQDLDLRVHAGAQYARIDHEFQWATVEENAVNGSITRTFRSRFDRSDTDAFGPRFGFDASLEIANGFSTVAHAAVGLLYASRDYDVVKTRAEEIRNVTTGVISTPLRDVRRDVRSADSNKQVIQQADASLGLRYTHHMDDNSGVMLEGGWRHHYYDDAIRREPHTGAPFSLSGPYLGLKYVG